MMNPYEVLGVAGVYGYEVVVNEYLTGSKRAVKLNGKICVSPAMHDLMVNATPEELEHLLRNIPLLDLDKAGLEPIGLYCAYVPMLSQ